MIDITVEPDCYSWYEEMFNSPDWNWSDWSNDWWIYQENWKDEWLGAERLWMTDDYEPKPFFRWSSYDKEKYDKPCPEPLDLSLAPGVTFEIEEPEEDDRGDKCYPWYDEMYNSDDWTWSSYSQDSYIYESKWDDEWEGAEDLWM